MVEKMKLLHITGPRTDIDRVMKQYLSKYDIHFENAMQSLGSLANVRPFVETNVYRDAYTKAKSLWEYVREEEKDSVELMRPKDAERMVEAIYRLTEEIFARQEEIRQQRLDLLSLMEQIEPFRELDFEFHRILRFQFIAFRFGRISRDYYQKLEGYIHETDHVLFYECHSDADYVWGAYFVPEMYKTEVDAVCMSFHFQRVYLPDSFEGTPDAAYMEAEKRVQELEAEDASLTEQLQSTLERHKKKLAAAYQSLESYCENFDIRKYAVCTKQTGAGEENQEYYILYGWMSTADARELKRDIRDDPMVHVMEEEVAGELSAEPPTKLKNPKIFKPFEMFVEMYGLPAYNEMDPTIFIALTYTLMFGIMFGDVGQGLCLVVGGFLLYRCKKMNLAAIVSLAGVWSTVFGFMYGSIFGFEDWLTPVWMRPMDNIMTTLMLAIGFGMILILIAMVINIVNAIRAKEVGRLLFSQSGVSGLICYGCVALCIVLYETGHAIPATGILAVAVGIPLIAIFLKEPLSNLVEHRKKIFPDGSKGMFFVEAFVELFDVVLSYATNSISFVRVGAFALSHAGMMGVVMTLAGYESGSPNLIVVVLGNILVTGLEGLVVGIQVLRLEYYEMFSRFYKGSGKPFHAYFKKNSN
jgi:V/A-type H+-transporting ATPase subunit I